MPLNHARGSALLKATRVLVAAVVLGTAGACGSSDPEPAPAPPAKDVTVAGSVVATAGSSNEMEIVVPEEVKASWSEIGANGSGVELLEVAGTGEVTQVPIDLSTDTPAQIDSLTQRMNGLDANAPDRSTLAGLNAITSDAGDPVWVFSPLLDTMKPVDFRQLAFDESPGKVIKAVKKADKLPSLKGRVVTFVVTPVAGEQEPLPELKVGYQRAVWEGLAKEAGAKRVNFFDGTGTVPGAGTIPAIPIQEPGDNLDSEQQDANTSTCTLPSPALFLPDQPTLIDKKATLKALKECVGEIDSSTKITVEGHTAGDPDENNAFAKDLSTRRATEVAALMKELGVPAKNVTKVVGYGSSKPLVEPGTDPKNRAVVVTFTIPS